MRHIRIERPLSDGRDGCCGSPLYSRLGTQGVWCTFERWHRPLDGLRYSRLLRVLFFPTPFPLGSSFSGTSPEVPPAFQPAVSQRPTRIGRSLRVLPQHHILKCTQTFYLMYAAETRIWHARENIFYMALCVRKARRKRLSRVATACPILTRDIAMPRPIASRPYLGIRRARGSPRTAAVSMSSALAFGRTRSRCGALARR